MKNEIGWPDDGHLYHRRAIPFVLQKGGETKLKFRGKGFVQETSKSPRCGVILYFDHSVNWTSIGSYDVQLRNGSVVYIFQVYSAKNNARLVVMMPKNMERKLKEFERHSNIDSTLFDNFNEGERVLDGRRESEREMLCWCSRCQVECDGDQVNTGESYQARQRWQLRYAWCW